MARPKSVYFCPVYDQIRDLPGFPAEIEGAALPCDTVLMVNNGSTDGSEELVRASGHPVLEVRENIGVGYAYMLAVEWALERWREVPVTMRYPTRKKGYSHIPPVKRWYEMMKPWVMARLDPKGFPEELPSFGADAA